MTRQGWTVAGLVALALLACGLVAYTGDRLGVADRIERAFTGDKLETRDEVATHRTGTLRLCQRIANRRGAPITSTWRSDSRNRAVGGVPNSMHTHGSTRNPGACDFGPQTERTRQLVARDCRRAGAIEVLVHAVPGGGRHTHCGWF